MRALRLALLAGLLLAVAQQQVLLHRPPRLLALEQAAASSGPAALSLRFSRPMNPPTVAARSRLEPPLRFDLQGGGNPLLLLPGQGQRLVTPLRLQLQGDDRRGLPMRPAFWQWDPRAHLLAVVPVGSGEQVQVRQHDGGWTALSPVWSSITEIEPLGDGSGVGVVSRDDQGRHQVWRLNLQERNLARVAAMDAPLRPDLGHVRQTGIDRFTREALQYAQLSSNRQGDLLVQSTALTQGPEELVQWFSGGGRRRLEIEASGPVALLPGGGELIVPEREGLSLRTLPPREPRRQILPGSRDLSSFCPVAGRALLVRHWPDFRRSLELVEPGQAPRPLWVGTAGLVASACSRGGERVWALLIEGIAEPRLILLALDRDGRVLQRRELSGWELEPGTGLHYDPTGERLLLTLRRLELDTPAGGPPQRREAQPALIDPFSLELTLIEKPVRQAQWLPAG
jgi:hypothetical protein